MNSRHEPWLFDPNHGANIAIYDARSEPIALVPKCSDNSEANARLIAASPDLLMACKKAIPLLLDAIGRGMLEEDNFSDRLVFDACEAAVLRAEWGLSSKPACR